MSKGTGIESVVSLPVINPDTGRASKSFRFSGVMDRLEGRRLIDWKSTSDAGRYVQEKRIGFQGELYALALKHKGVEIDEIEYRLVTSPNIKYCKKDIDRDAYEERCLEWLLADPLKLVGHVYHITESRLKQAQQFLWDGSKRVLDCRRNDRWMPSEKACYAWNRCCEYMPLCEAVANGGDVDYVIGDRFEVLDDPHPEIAADTKKDVLSYSALSTLTLCEVMYHWKYERGLRPKHDHSEAMWRGSAMHVGLEAYANNGEAAALTAIDAWSEANWTLGESEAHRQAQETAKARAMVRAAAMRWPI